MSKPSPRGRPIGYKLSEVSKKAISRSKTGQHHTQATKDKISKTLTNYFKKLHPLSEELSNSYKRLGNDGISEWLSSRTQELDSFDDVITDRYMHTTTKIELAYGVDIERFSHNLTPEIILILKEKCAELGIDLEEYL